MRFSANSAIGGNRGDVDEHGAREEERGAGSDSVTFTARFSGLKAWVATASSPRLLVAGVVLVLSLLSGLGVAVSRSSAAVAVQGAATIVETSPVQIVSDLRRGEKCYACGVIESVRAIEPRAPDARGEQEFERYAARVARRGDLNEAPEKSVRLSEVTVRMNDGTSRQFVTSASVANAKAMNVSNVSSSSNWHPGERMIFIDGTDATNRR